MANNEETKKPTTTKKPVVKKEVSTPTKPEVKKATATSAKPEVKKATTTSAKPEVKKATASKKEIVKKATGKSSEVKKPLGSKPKRKPKVKNTTKSTVTSSQLPKSVFDVKINEQAIFDTILSERSSRRQGTSKVKNRGEKRGGGRKPWAQKGTGNARAGSNRSPIWVGGGVVHGPRNNRNYSLKVNKKIRLSALLSSLTLKAQDKEVFLNEMKMDAPSTKELIKTLSALKINDKKLLIVTDDVNVFKSASNVPNLIVNRSTSLLVEEIVNADGMLINKEGIKNLERLVK